jgi:FAD/FMN-containing dehydrogenase/Fe-S oxidoreductase
MSTTTGPSAREMTNLRPPDERQPPVDADSLAEALDGAIRGEVRFDDGSRGLYATDASNYRQVPIGVVIPRDADDVVAALAVCRRFGAPVLARGGGTSLAGQCCNAGVVFDFSKYMNRVLEIDPERRIARVQPGVILDVLRQEAERHHLTFAPDPSTHSHCTLGGMIGNNSCGVHSVMGGKTDDNVEELEVVTYGGARMRVGRHSEEELERIVRGGGARGEIYGKLRAFRDRYAGEIRERFPDIPRRVSGYNLPWLLAEHGFDVAKTLVGSECTCVLLLEATVRLVWSPPARTLLVLGYPDVYAAADHVTELMKFHPIGLEGIDDRLVSDMRAIGLHPSNLKLLPEGKGWLLVEFGGHTREESDAAARRAMDALGKGEGAPSMRLYDDRREEAQIWKVRESGLGATAHVPGKALTWEGWEDSAVPPERLGEYLRELRKLLEQHGYTGDFYGHFGQGCLHTRINFDLETQPGIAKFRSFLHEAARLVVRFGGSLSGEHGDGQSRAELLPIMFGDEMIGAFREFKAIWDPQWRMNPGKLVNAYRVDENLRLGASFRAAHPQTHFRYPSDQGDFSRAVLRCVGVGNCRRLEGGTMCPSFMVTREEEHSTRGRARLLFEMLQGEVLTDAWRDPHVREALDLCLACKGCKGDCPVNVDMATYKAEFLSHYYEGRLRPRSAYSMGLIHRWARLASLAPGLANFATHAPGLSRLARWIGGISPERDLPEFAPQTFRSWFNRRSGHGTWDSGLEQRGADSQSRVPSSESRPRVFLFPDTFNNHFLPETGRAAVEVLEAAGFEVSLPRRPLCCGRPLYDFGMLDLAKRLLRQVLEELRPQLSEGIPIVVLEPSCAAVFRDELPNLFPFDEDALRLKEQTYLLSEFLTKKAAGWTIPRIGRRAIVQDHCHHKAVMGVTDEQAILQKAGLDFETPNDGCCGMAGSFGFEESHYGISMDVGDRKLFPALRAAPADTLLVADGFSCREQIRSATGRLPLHLAQVLRMGLPGGQTRSGERQPRSRSRGTGGLIVAGAALAAAGALVWRAIRKKR